MGTCNSGRGTDVCGTSGAWMKLPRDHSCLVTCHLVAIPGGGGALYIPMECCSNGMNTKAPQRWQHAVSCGCSLGWCEECHEELSVCFLMNEVRLHDGSRSIELTFAAVLGKVSEMTEACFTNHAGRDFPRACVDTCADNTAGYATRGCPMRATRWQLGSTYRRTSSPPLRRCLAVYFMSDKAMLQVDGVRAEVADAMNPDVR